MKKQIIFSIFFVISSFITGQIVQDINNYAHFISSHNQPQSKNSIIHNHFLQDYNVTFYFLDLNVENNTVYIYGNVGINAVSQVPILDTFAVELVQNLANR